MIEFKSRTVTATLMDPRENFARKEIKIEYRFDPLTGESSRLAHFGMFKPQKEDLSSWDTLESRSRCPFCPPNIEKVTPRFEPDILPEGHLHRGEATLLPNISPYDSVSALTVMSRDHLVPLEKLSFRLLKDAFEAGVDFFRLISAKKYNLPYYFITWNYMPPSGGGIVHPHQQVIISDSPGNLFRKVLENSKRYYLTYQKNYWKELCRTEKERKERFIGEFKKSCWLTAFAPLGVLGEFWGIFPDVHSIFDIDEKVIEELVNGLIRLFRYFDSVEIFSFNMGLFFVPQGAEEYCSLHVRVIPRLFLNPIQKPPDVNALQMVLQEPFTVVRPEEQCAELKALW